MLLIIISLYTWLLECTDNKSCSLYLFTWRRILYHKYVRSKAFVIQELDDRQTQTLRGIVLGFCENRWHKRDAFLTETDRFFSSLSFTASFCIRETPTLHTHTTIKQLYDALEEDKMFGRNAKLYSYRAKWSNRFLSMSQKYNCYKRFRHLIIK